MSQINTQITPRLLNQDLGNVKEDVLAYNYHITTSRGESPKPTKSLDMNIQINPSNQNSK